MASARLLPRSEKEKALAPDDRSPRDHGVNPPPPPPHCPNNNRKPASSDRNGERSVVASARLPHIHELVRSCVAGASTARLTVTAASELSSSSYAAAGTAADHDR